MFGKYAKIKFGENTKTGFDVLLTLKNNKNNWFKQITNKNKYMEVLIVVTLTNFNYVYSFYSTDKEPVLLCRYSSIYTTDDLLNQVLSYRYLFKFKN